MGTTVMPMSTDEPLTGPLARVVTDALKDAGRSQRDIAQTTGIPIATLSRRLTGRSPFITTELSLIAAELHTNVSDFYLAAEVAA